MYVASKKSAWFGRIIFEFGVAAVFMLQPAGADAHGQANDHGRFEHRAKPFLRFGSDRAFKIVQFTDTRPSRGRLSAPA